MDRARLVDRLLREGGTPVVAVVAPAGYGKTSLLTQWLRSDTRPSTWVTIHREDNDPATLLVKLAHAFRATGHVNEDVLADMRLPSSDAPTLGVARLAAVLVEASSPSLIVLDNVERLTSRGSKDLVMELAMRLPRGATLALGSRVEPPVHSASLRATGRILELTLADLAMDEAEASALLASEGIDLGDDLSKVVARAEGWPAAIYLVALAIKVGATKESALQIGGDDWYISDYLQEQVLNRLTPDRLDFLVKSSILDQMSAPLCDHTLQTTGSDRRLRKLEASNMLVVPVDRSRSWFRYHTLLRDHLTTELERRSPDEVAGLHLRASEWFEAHDMIESAIHHAQRAGDGRRAAPLIARITRTVYATGGSDTVRSWMDWYERTGRITEAPTLAPMAAIAEALDGRADEAERWMTLVDGTVRDRNRNPIGRLARSIIAPRDLESMLDDATAASEALRDTDWLPGALLVCALAKLWMDEVDQADEMLDRVIRIGEERSAPPTTSYALATRAAISRGRGHHGAAEDLASQAVDLVRRYHIERMATSCLPFVMAAQCAAHRGAIESARSRLNEAAGVRPRLTRVVPVVAVATLLEFASAYVEIADVSGARGVMRDLVAITPPDLGTLTTRRTHLEAVLAALPTGNVGVSTLTTAELRLLPLLATHLSFPEIGDRLFVSRHTVKTQAMSIYRKLEVSSRSDAVTRSRDLGLLGP